jgi:hypothetical protein
MQPPHTYYRGVNGEIFDVFWDNQYNTSRFNQLNCAGLTQAPPAADDSDPLMIEHSPGMHIFYRAVNGEIFDVFWNMQYSGFGFNLLNCAGLTQAPPAADDPVIMKYSPGLHIFYRGVNGEVCDVFCDAQYSSFGFSIWNIGGLTQAPPVEKSSNLSIVKYSPGLHIFYRGVNGEVCDVFCDAQYSSGFSIWNFGGPPSAGNPTSSESE